MASSKLDFTDLPKADEEERAAARELAKDLTNPSAFKAVLTFLRKRYVVYPEREIDVRPAPREVFQLAPTVYGTLDHARQETLAYYVIEEKDENGKIWEDRTSVVEEWTGNVSGKMIFFATRKK